MLFVKKISKTLHGLGIVFRGIVGDKIEVGKLQHLVVRKVKSKPRIHHQKRDFGRNTFHQREDRLRNGRIIGEEHYLVYCRAISPTHAQALEKGCCIFWVYFLGFDYIISRF